MIRFRFWVNGQRVHDGKMTTQDAAAGLLQADKQVLPGDRYLVVLEDPTWDGQDGGLPITDAGEWLTLQRGGAHLAPMFVGDDLALAEKIARDHALKLPDGEISRQRRHGLKAVGRA